MKKVLIAYYSLTGITGKMAGYIAEGIRFTGNEAVIKPVTGITDASDLNGYDGYIFGAFWHVIDKRFVDLQNGKREFFEVRQR